MTTYRAGRHRIKADLWGACEWIACLSKDGMPLAEVDGMPSEVDAIMAVCTSVDMGEDAGQVIELCQALRALERKRSALMLRWT